MFRVAYRENELKKRQDEKRLLQQKVSEEQEEKERKLEKLREQVRNLFYYLDIIYLTSIFHGNSVNQEQGNGLDFN